MKKFIAFISAAFLIGALSAPVFATEPAETDNSGVLGALDRNSVWTDFIEERNQTASSDGQSTNAPNEDQAEMKIKTQDMPWQRVG